MEHVWLHGVGLHLLDVLLVVVEDNARGVLLQRQHCDLQPHQVVGLGDVAGERGLVAVRDRDLADCFYHLLHEELRARVVLLEVEARIHIERRESRRPGCVFVYCVR